MEACMCQNTLDIQRNHVVCDSLQHHGVLVVYDPLLQRCPLCHPQFDGREEMQADLDAAEKAAGERAERIDEMSQAAKVLLQVTKRVRAVLKAMENDDDDDNGLRNAVDALKAAHQPPAGLTQSLDTVRKKDGK